MPHPAETLSLAEFLLGIAGDGWPEDRLEARRSKMTVAAGRYDWPAPPRR